MPGILPIAPERDGYVFEPGSGIVTTRLDGGADRQRLDTINTPHIVQLQWIIRGESYPFFMSFFRETNAEGSLPFLADLLTDARVLTRHKCRCAGGRMPRLVKNMGDAYFVQGAFEVEPNPSHFGTVFLITDTPTTPPTVDCGGFDIDGFLIGNQFRLIDVETGGLSFDGTYTITGLPGSNMLQASAAASVNANWLAINPTAGIGVTSSYITRVATL